jgi:glycosyltransferase involved in cell wall biosynthesis
VLMVLPADRHGRMAAVGRQIESMASIGVEVDVLEVRGRSKLKYLQSLPDLARRSRAVDLVHAHYGLCGWFARTNLGKPLVVSFMGSDLLGTAVGSGRPTRLSRVVVRLDRFLAGLVDAVIVKSWEMADRVAPVKAYVIPNGVDLRAFTPTPPIEARRRLGWTFGHVVLFPGCVQEVRKGFDLARVTVERASASIGKPIKIVPLCDIPAADVPLYMNACDALLMTSYWEGSPNAVKEAMACNLPVVSVPVGDVLQLLDGVRACAVRERDEHALAMALAQVVTAQERSSGRSALRRQGLDLDTIARRVRAVYEDVLSAVSVPARAHG